MKKLRSLSYDELRARLEALHAETEVPDEVRRLIHELEIHQVELEMQNRELAEAQQTLEESRDRYVDLYDGAPVGYLTLRGDGTLRELNLKAAQMIGVERVKLIDASFLFWLPPPDRSRLLAYLRRHPPGADSSVDLRLRPKSGEERMIRLQALWGDDREGAGRLCRAAMLDITEQERAQGALREANRRKDEFLMMLGHELRNPLAPVCNAAGVLHQHYDDPEQVRWAARIIDRQCGHMSRLVDDLLDVSRITQGNIHLLHADVDLRQPVERAIEQARPQFKERHQVFHATLPPTPVPVHGDAVRLAQVVVNLLTNASKFSPDGSRIRISVAANGQEARVWVKDEGIGMSRELLPHIFEPFVQAPQSADRNPGGLGLGLALARELARMHGGRLEAASAGEGKGSIFTLCLPLGAAVPAAEREPRSSPAPRPASADGGLTILIVDDNRDVAESTAMLLDLSGHRARAVPDGEAALKATETLHPDVIILDIGLPRMEGFEVARRLRQTPAGRHATILAVSGYDLTGRGRSDLKLFDSHLLKPVGLKAMLAAIERHRHAG